MHNKDLNTSFQPDQDQYLVAQILKLRQRLILLKKVNSLKSRFLKKKKKKEEEKGQC